jgi:hypothetical protein
MRGPGRYRAVVRRPVPSFGPSRHLLPKAEGPAHGTFLMLPYLKGRAQPDPAEHHTRSGVGLATRPLTCKRRRAVRRRQSNQKFSRRRCNLRPEPSASPLPLNSASLFAMRVAVARQSAEMTG